MEYRGLLGFGGRVTFRHAETKEKGRAVMWAYLQQSGGPASFRQNVKASQSFTLGLGLSLPKLWLRLTENMQVRRSQVGVRLVLLHTYRAVSRQDFTTNN